MMPHVVSVRSVEELDAHRPAWSELVSRAADGAYFHAPEWLLPWLETYWADRPLSFLFVYEGDRLAGFVPLLEDNGGEIQCPGSVASPINPHSRREELLFADDPAPILNAALEHLVANQPRHRVVFRSVTEDGPVASALPAIAHKLRLRVLAQNEATSSVADLSDGWDSYMRTRDKHTAHEMRRKTKKLHKAGGWEMRSFTSGSDWRVGFDALLEVERGSWKHGEQTSIANEPGAREFYQAVTRRGAESGRLRLHVLSHDAHPIAHVLGVADGNTLLALKTSYQESYRSWSPGMVLMWHVLEKTAHEGFQTLDFLGESAPWKASLSSRTVSYRNFCVFPPFTMRCEVCRTMELQVKPLVRPLAQRIRAWRGSGRQSA